MGKILADQQQPSQQPKGELFRNISDTKAMVIFCGVVTVVGIVAAIAIGLLYHPAPGGPASPDPELARISVIDTCQGSVKHQLKDPDSAKFRDWTAVVVPSNAALAVDHKPVDGDTAYHASGQVNAKNGFGGYTGFQPFECDAVVSTDGQTYALAWTSVTGFGQGM